MAPASPDFFFSSLVKLMASPASLLLILSLLAAAYSLLRRRRGQLRLPPGPWGLPIVGYVPFLRHDLHQQFAELAQTHGPIMSLRLGAKTCVVITSPSIAGEIFRGQDAIFANRDPPASAVALSCGCQDLVWSPNGPLWRFLRKLTVREVMSPTRLDAFAHLRLLEVRRMLHHIMERSGATVDLAEEAFITALNSTTAMLWGGTLEGDERERIGSQFRQVAEEAVELLGAVNVSDLLPWLARFDLQGVVREMEKRREWLHRILDDVVKQKLKKDSETVKEKSSAKQGEDFLQVLLSLCEEGGEAKELNITNIKSLFVDLVLGATDTTSNTISWAMAELLRHPHILSKAQEEIDSVVGKDKLVEESILPNLPYTKAIIKEVLRLHTVVPLLTPRRPSEASIVSGYTIPRNAQIMVNAWAIHRDAKLWDSPLEFQPERFLREDNNFHFSGTNQDLRYIPFGAGRRICVGISMADRMTAHILASLLHAFDWKLPDGEKLDMSEQFGIVLKKATPLVAVPTPRLSLQF